MALTVEQIEAAILTAVRAAGYGNVQASDTPDKIGFDSLDVVELSIALEEAFARELPEDWFENDELRGKTFAELAVVLHGKLSE